MMVWSRKRIASIWLIVTVAAPAFADIVLVTVPNIQGGASAPIVILRATAEGLIENGRILPEGGLAGVMAYPDERLLLVWGASNGNVEKTTTSGFLKIVDIANPCEYMRVPLPCVPTSGGYLLRDPGTGNLRIATPDNTTTPGSTLVYNAKTGVLSSVATASIAWEHVVMPGGDYRNACSAPFIGSVGKGNRLNVRIWGTAYDIKMDVPENVLDPKEANTSWVTVAARDDKYTIVTAGSREERDNYRVFCVKDASGKWTKLKLRGYRTRLTMCGGWLVFTEGYSEFPDRKGKVLLTGNMTLVKSGSTDAIVVSLPENARVLTVDSDKVYYHDEENVYERDMEGPKAVSRRICSLGTVQDVQFGFAVPPREATRVKVKLSLPRPEDYGNPCFVLVGEGGRIAGISVRPVFSGSLQGKYEVVVGHEGTVRHIGYVDVKSGQESQECVVKPDEGHLRRWWLWSPDERLSDMKAGRGVQVTGLGVTMGRGATGDLATEYVRAKGVIQLSYAAVDADVSSVGAFITGETGVRELLLLGDKPSGRAMELYGERWFAMGVGKDGKPDGTGPAEHMIAGRAAAIIVNPANKLESLTLGQIQAIFQGDVDDWAVIGGTGLQPAGARPGTAVAPGGKLQINLFGLGANEPAAAVFEKEGVPRDKWRRVTVRASAAEAVAAVSVDPQAMAFVDLTAIPASSQSVKVLPIKFGQGEKARNIAPTAENIKNAMYPLSQRYFLYVHPKASDTAKDFASFLATCGGSEATPYADTVKAVMETYRKHGLIPLADAAIERAAKDALAEAAAKAKAEEAAKGKRK